MRRRRFSSILHLSLIVLAAVCVLWMRSYWRGDCVNLWNRSHSVSLESRAGYLSAMVSNLHGDAAGAVYWNSVVGRLSDERRGRRALATANFMGVSFCKDIRPGSAVGLVDQVVNAGMRIPQGMVKRYLLWIPYWAVAMLAAAPGVLALWRRKRLHRRQATGLCIQCGYNLRGSALKCPECGTN